MQIKTGDNVRYLNAVGGGRVVRIVDNIAYVDEDGFETPVLLKECVVVGNTTRFNNPVPTPEKDVPKAAAKAAQQPLPVVETPGGDELRLVLGFEPSDIKALSRSTFDAYIVNDSNYYVYLALMSRSADSAEWTHRFDGLIEPNMQEFLCEIEPSDLPAMDRLAVQYVVFKRSKVFTAVNPALVELKVDTTKFARLHCFKSNPYFDNPVIAFDIAECGRPVAQVSFRPEDIEQGIKAKKRDIALQNAARKPAAPLRADIIEVDLHADELLDTTAGLGPADILNMQIDRFCNVMDANLRNVGQKIVFIHGKGEGVLRQAIMKELTHRYKGHDVQDASFREYGFGATQVTIRNISPKAQRRK